MSNEYYTASEITRLTTARSSQENSDRAAVEAAFDKLPSPTQLRTETANYAVATGTDAYSVTLAQITAYSDGIKIRAKIPNANTGASTLNVSGLGARAIKKPDGTDPGAGDLAANSLHEFVYNATTSQFVLTTVTSSDLAEAAASATAAATARDKAEQWAEEVEDTEVETGQYSALHHAAKAADSATAAADSATAAAASATDFATRLGRRNEVTNGDFGVWQRGTSFTGTGYTADRWMTSRSSGSATVSRQDFPLGDEAIHFLRYAATSVVIPRVTQRVAIRAFGYGTTVTLSFRARVGSGTRSLGASMAQVFGSGGSATVSIAAQSVTLTTSWQQFNLQFTMPSIAGKTIGTNPYISLDFTPGDGSYTFDLADVQLERGSAATPFERLTFSDTLALCQWFYRRINFYSRFDGDLGAANASAGSTVSFPQMRTAPTATLLTVAPVNAQNVVFETSNNESMFLRWEWTGSGVTSRDIRGTIELDSEL